MFKLITKTIAGIPEIFKGYFSIHRKIDEKTTVPGGFRRKPRAAGYKTKK